MKKLTHVNKEGRVRMVDVSKKKISTRCAVAEGRIYVAPETIKLIKDNRLTKGDCLNTARIAGIMAAKNTSSIIPLCHTLGLDYIDIEFKLNKDNIHIQAQARTKSRTGVEMEALTAVSAAGLAIYDMCKAVDKGMFISEIKLLKKTKT